MKKGLIQRLRFKRFSKSEDTLTIITKKGKIIRLSKVSKETIEANRASIYDYRF